MVKDFITLVTDIIKHSLTMYGVVSRKGEPGMSTLNGWAVLGKPIYQMECDICHLKYWGRFNPKYQICGRFNCYRKTKKLKSEASEEKSRNLEKQY